MSRKSVETVQEVYEAFGRRDLAKVFRLLSPQVEIVQSAELPWGGVYKGHEDARMFFGKLGSAIDSTLEFERMISAGDRVAAVGWTQGTVRGNGASYRVPVVHVWTVLDGVVIRAEFLIENATMLEALG